MKPLTAERLRELLDYDAATGEFVNRVARGPRTAGAVAGYLHKSGYPAVEIEGKEYQSHRLAWLWTHGIWPAVEIDHIDGDRRNNRLSNLREANTAENAANRKLRCDNLTGMKGVTRAGSRFMARITVRGKSIYLGRFCSKDDAHAAYLQAAVKHFGEFARAA